MAGEVVVRIREESTGADRYGNPVAEDVPTDIPGAFVAPEPASTESASVGRETLLDALTVYWHKEWPDIVATDRLQVRGVEYRVDGVPSDWRDPWGTVVGGLVVRLTRSA